MISDETGIDHAAKWCLSYPGYRLSGMVSHFYNAMRFGMAYRDPGANHYERKYRERVIKSLHRRAAEFGYTLQATDCVS